MNKPMKFVMPFVFVIILLICICVGLCYRLKKKREENYASPGRVCYYGRMYGCRGYSSEEIPEEFTYVGEVNNIGAKLLDEEDHHHLNGDVTGSLYVNPERPDILYFDRADWRWMEKKSI